MHCRGLGSASGVIRYAGRSGAFARLLKTQDYTCGWPRERYERFLAAFEETWLSGGEPGRRNPGISDDPRYREWFTRFVRLAANPFMAQRLAEMNADIDIRPLLGNITARHSSSSTPRMCGSRQRTAGTSRGTSPVHGCSNCPASTMTRGSAKPSRCCARSVNSSVSYRRAVDPAWSRRRRNG